VKFLRRYGIFGMLSGGARGVARLNIRYDDDIRSLWRRRAALRQNVLLNAGGTVLPIGNTIQKKYRDSFSGGALDAAKRDVGQTGVGITYAQANGLLGDQTGTTLADELTLTFQGGVQRPAA
jgi:hypothetical protein